MSGEQAEERTAREGRLRQIAFTLAEDCVRDYGRALPNDKHWKIAIEKTTAAIYRELCRISDETAPGSEALPGVSTAVESSNADEKGLASRVEELREMLKAVVESAVDGADYCLVCMEDASEHEASCTIGLAKLSLAGAHAEEKE